MDSVAHLNPPDTCSQHFAGDSTYMFWFNRNPGGATLPEQHLRASLVATCHTSSGNDSTKPLNQPTEAKQSARKGVGEMTACQNLHKKVSLVLFCRSVEKVCGTKEAVTFYWK